MKKHKWSKGQTRSRSQDWFCEDCGQSTNKILGDEPENESYGPQLEDCEKFQFKIISALKNSQNMKDKANIVLGSKF